MTLQCVRSGLLLERRQSGLSSANGLALEEHLAKCPSCRQQADRLDALRGLIASAPEALAPRVRQRAIRNAIARGTAVARQGQGAAGAAARSRWTMGSLGFAAVVGSALAAAAAVAVWPRISQTPRAPSARTAGTPRAVVAPDAIDSQPVPAVTPPSGTSAPAVEPIPHAPSRPPERVPPAPTKERAARVSAHAHLRAARAALARQDVALARTELERALRARPSRAEQAEAHTLAAECALVSGQRERAVALYRVVADRYRGLDAGENALFAAARVAHEAGDVAQARKLLERYLQRHPRGRFRSDAERRLKDTARP